MDAIILAAGRGRRLKRVHNKLPKCMIQVGDQLLIERLIADLLDLGVNKIILCTGFGANHLMNLLNDRFATANIQYVFNPFYRITNNSYTLWLARNKSKDDFLLINGDNLLDKKMIQEVMKFDGTVIPFVKKAIYDQEDMKIQVDASGTVSAISKSIRENVCGESIGLRKVAKGDSKYLWRALYEVLFVHWRFNAFYTEAFQCMADQGRRISTLDVSRYYCDEVDTEEDFERISSQFSN
jgi:choline kinase